MPSRVVKFGTSQVHLDSGEVFRDGINLKLGGQSFQVLEFLSARSGEVVNRKKLRMSMWPSDTFVDFDHGLNTALSKIREALGDSASNPRFIETVLRRGYRFIAPMSRPRKLHAETKAPLGDAVLGHGFGEARYRPGCSTNGATKDALYFSIQEETVNIWIAESAGRYEKCLPES